MSTEGELQRLLSEDIHFLGDVLGRVIRRQAGVPIFELEERMRALTKARRMDEEPAIDQAIENLVDSLSVSEAELVSRAFTVYFELINLAEEQHRVRILRERERTAHPRPLPESIQAAVERLHQLGLDDYEMRALLDRLRIELVFTAHPTQAKRRTVLSKLRRITEALNDLRLQDLLPAERQQLVRHVTAEITSLWLTRRSRTTRLAVTDEVRTGLYYVDTTLWEVIPEIYERMAEALAHYYPTLSPPPEFLTFGSWIGGDRDGNPNVTADVSAETLRLHRGLAVERHRAMATQLNRSLTVSASLAPVEPELIDALATTRSRSSHLAFLQERYPNEPYRLWSAALAADLKDASEGDMVARLKGLANPPLQMRRKRDLLDPLSLIDRSLRKGGQTDIAVDILARMRRQAQVFGLHVARLDIRQYSDYHTDVLDELLSVLGLYEGFGGMVGAERADVLSELLTWPIPDLSRLETADLSVESRETLALFQMLHRGIDFYGPEIVGTYIVSMTHGPEDILAPLLLAYWHHLCLRPDRSVEGLSFTPLFETREDLRAAPDVMATLFRHNAYLPHLERLEQRQAIMIGYSDSNKDAGYLAANWELYQAQEMLAATCQQFDVVMTLFHGRGGTIARGGGPANRAILAQPPGSVEGRVRITEQGEVIDERYGHPGIARRHLEQVVNAVLLSSVPSHYGTMTPPSPSWREAMDELADLSYRAYRNLVYETPELLVYWQQATPIAEISQMQIGSRPARRQAGATFAGLRAIPWGFSWMQSRHVLPGWYGVGAALSGYGTAPDRVRRLQEMYRQWPFFQGVLDNAQVSLVKADMSIARLYAGLVEEDQVRDLIFGRIGGAFSQTCDWILRVSGQQQLLDNDPVLRLSVQRRNPYVDPLNYIQVSLLRRLRFLPEHESPTAQQILEGIFLTINGIASGLKNTG